MAGGVFSVVKTDRQMSDGLLEPAGAAEGLIVPTVGITMSLSARHEKAGGKGHWHWGPVAGPLPPGPWFWVFPTYPCTMCRFYIAVLRPPWCQSHCNAYYETADSMSGGPNPRYDGGWTEVRPPL